MKLNLSGSLLEGDKLPSNIGTQTLLDYINKLSNEHNKGLTFYKVSGDKCFVSYSDFFKCACFNAGKIQARGLSKGDYLVLLLDDEKDFYISFWACLLSGVIAVPLNLPARYNAADVAVKKIDHVRKILKKPSLLTTEKISKKLFQCFPEIPSTDRILLKKVEGSEFNYIPVNANDTAFIQFSSGSTGNPKGVILTHYNLVHNCYALKCIFVKKENDTVISWLPFSHDMGLVGLHLGAVVAGLNQIHLPPSLYFRSPETFLRIAMEHKATITAMPNFAYDYAVDRLKKGPRNNLDLSHFSIMMNGAEPVQRKPCRRFVNFFSKYGLNDKALTPVYGMAEACLGVSFSVTAAGFSFVTCDKQFYYENTIKKVESSENSIDIISVGKAVPGVSIKVAGIDGSILKRGEVGLIWIKGPNVTNGYITANSPCAKNMFSDGWLNTGDKGFFYKENLYISGRDKDIICIKGKNIFANDIEHLVKAAIDTNCEIAVSARDDGAGEKNEILCFIQTRCTPQQYQAIIKKIFIEIKSNYNFEIVHFIKIAVLPKTTSGKKQRYLLKNNFEKNIYKDDTLSFNTILDILTEVIKPYTNRQSMMIKIWSDILELNSSFIGINHSFKLLGGNSVKAIQFLSQLEELVGKKIKQDILLSCNTIEEIDQQIENFIISDNDFLSKVTPSEGPLEIIGMSCLYPGANNVHEFWDLLKQGRVVSPAIKSNRLKMIGGDETTPLYCQADGIESFDCDFFNINSEESPYIDPQQRKLLEQTYHALEDASLLSLIGKGTPVGVYVGASQNSYQDRFIKDCFKTDLPPGVLVNNMLSTLATRVSNCFDFTGPSVVFDTACSSSIVALDYAVSDLRSKKINYAVVAGVNFISSSDFMKIAKKAGILSLSNKAEIFNDNANGTVIGEGIGVVILKLASSENTGALPYCRIVDCRTNNDGKALSLMAPKASGQMGVIKSLYANKKNNVGYIEAHGTGTSIGDQVECSVLNTVFGGNGNNIAIGSVKANIGHQLAGAGIAGLIKTALCLYHKCLVPMPGTKKLNREFAKPESPFFLLKTMEPWLKNDAHPRKAALSSFGFGGTNAHMILEEPVLNSDPVESPCNLIPLAANCSQGLNSLEEMVKFHFKKASGNDGFDLHYRILPQFDYRKIFRISENGLKRIDNVAINLDREKKHGLVFAFTGQGGLYPELLCEINSMPPIFKKTFRYCSDYFSNLTGRAMDDILKTSNKVELNRNPLYAQPILFSLQVSSLQILNALGIKPDAVIGHSLGEIAAAVAAGIISLDDGLSFVAARASAFNTVDVEGTMMTVFTEADLVETICHEYSKELTVSVINSKTMCGVSGPDGALAEIRRCFDLKDIKYKQLMVSHPFHSPMIRPVLESIEKEIKKICFKKPKLPYYSSVTGKLEDQALVNEGYWLNQIIEPVLFYEAVKALNSNSSGYVLEIGPRPLKAGGFVSLKKDVIFHHSVVFLNLNLLSIRNSPQLD